MALSSVMGAPISRPAGFDSGKPQRASGLLWAAFLTLLVAGPWLLPGYLFGTDWPGPRHVDFPTSLHSAVPLDFALWGLSLVVGAEVMGKVLVLGSLFLACVTSFLAVPTGGFAARAAASIIFVVNPFVYGRLHYGQLYLVAAYALLPWVAVRVRKLLVGPNIKADLLAALGMTLLGVLDLHLFLVAAVMATLLLLTHAIASVDKAAYLKRLAPDLLLAAGATFAGSAYWIVPLLLGRGPEAATIAGIGTGNLIAYSAVPDPVLGLVPNLLGLYGFWAEDAGRFSSMKAFVPLWPLLLAAFLVLAACGAFVSLKRRQNHLAPWVGGLLLAAVVGLFLEMGVSNPWTSGLVSWLASEIHIYSGMRDAGKWGALLAFVYSQLCGLGVAAILGWIGRLKLGRTGTDWLAAGATGLLLALPLYYGNGLLFGSHRGIQPSAYPTGWYAADRLLLGDPHPGRTLFLPWHEYLSFDFIQNENRVIVSPAPTFFSTPVIVSANPEILGTAPPTDPDQVAISQLVRDGPLGKWASVLAAHGVKYVLLSRTVDWSSYSYLDSQSGLAQIADLQSIIVYRVAPSD